MMYFRACPKCHGDVVFERDVYGNYLACLQCGLVIDSRLREEVTENPAREDPTAA